MTHRIPLGNNIKESSEQLKLEEQKIMEEFTAQANHPVEKQFNIL
jgi:hypothetical protein